MFTAVRRKRHSRGQALVEFAIVVPVFMLIVGGIIQFGVIFWGQNTLNQVARDTGRWAASQQTVPCTGTDVLGTANLIAANSSLIGYSTWTAANVTASWSGTPCPPVNNQNVAWVTITLKHRVPLFFPWVPGDGNISTTTQFRMEPKPR